MFNIFQSIFFLFVFYVITIALFIERFIFYSFMSEHLDLRHVMGVGIAITRGSAASLSFNFCLLLLTMSRYCHKSYTYRVTHLVG